MSPKCVHIDKGAESTQIKVPFRNEVGRAKCKVPVLCFIPFSYSTISFPLGWCFAYISLKHCSLKTLLPPAWLRQSLAGSTSTVASKSYPACQERLPAQLHLHYGACPRIPKPPGGAHCPHTLEPSRFCVPQGRSHGSTRAHSTRPTAHPQRCTHNGSEEREPRPGVSRTMCWIP